MSQGPITSLNTLKNNLGTYISKEGQSRVKTTVVVLELPFNIQDEELNSLFTKKFGKVKRMEMYVH